MIEGDVRIQAGARITTSLAPRSVSPDAGGFVYLFAPNVENDGTILTPAGETLLAAAQVVPLAANAYQDGGIPSNAPDPTFRAVGIDRSNNPEIWRTDGPLAAQISSPGSVINRGLIDAERGDVILNGDYVVNGISDAGQGGIVRADTSITRNG